MDKLSIKPREKRHPESHIDSGLAVQSSSFLSFAGAVATRAACLPVPGYFLSAFFVEIITRATRMMNTTSRNCAVPLLDLIKFHFNE